MLAYYAPASGQVMKQCSFLIDDLTDSVKL